MLRSGSMEMAELSISTDLDYRNEKQLRASL